jgi:hypothetical protein
MACSLFNEIFINTGVIYWEDDGVDECEGV